jgi:hypothetical protein
MHPASTFTQQRQTYRQLLMYLADDELFAACAEREVTLKAPFTPQSKACAIDAMMLCLDRTNSVGLRAVLLASPEGPNSILSSVIRELVPPIATSPLASCSAVVVVGSAVGSEAMVPANPNEVMSLQRWLQEVRDDETKEPSADGVAVAPIAVQKVAIAEAQRIVSQMSVSYASSATNYGNIHLEFDDKVKEQDEEIEASGSKKTSVGKMKSNVTVVQDWVPSAVAYIVFDSLQSV